MLQTPGHGQPLERPRSTAMLEVLRDQVLAGNGDSSRAHRETGKGAPSLRRASTPFPVSMCLISRGPGGGYALRQGLWWTRHDQVTEQGRLPIQGPS